MKMNITYVDIACLVEHEHVDHKRLEVVRAKLLTEGVIRRPVIVDKATNIILDGHHRVRALQELGIRHAPVAYVRYQDKRVRVYLRRKDILMKIIKKYVVEMAMRHKVCPSKTTRHLIHNRPVMKPVRIEDLDERWRSSHTI